MLDLRSAVLAIENDIANFDIHWDSNAIIKSAWAYCDNGSFLWLLFGGIWDNKTRCGLLLSFADLDDDSIF